MLVRKLMLLCCGGLLLAACESSSPKNGVTDNFWELGLPEMEKASEEYQKVNAREDKTKAYFALSKTSDVINSGELRDVSGTGMLSLTRFDNLANYLDHDGEMPYVRSSRFSNEIGQYCEAQTMTEEKGRTSASRIWFDTKQDESRLKKEGEYVACPVRLKGTINQSRSRIGEGGSAESISLVDQEIEIVVENLVRKFRVTPEPIEIPKACLNREAFTSKMDAEDLQNLAIYDGTENYGRKFKAYKKVIVLDGTEDEAQALEKVPEAKCEEAYAKLMENQVEKFDAETTELNPVLNVNISATGKQVGRDRISDNKRDHGRWVAEKDFTYTISYLVPNAEDPQTNREKAKLFVRVAVRYNVTEKAYSDKKDLVFGRRLLGMEIREDSESGKVLATVEEDTRYNGKEKSKVTVKVNGQEIDLDKERT